MVVVGADAPHGAVVAVEPGAVADVLAGFAGDRHRLRLALLQQIDLAVARPDIVAVAAAQSTTTARLALFFMKNAISSAVATAGASAASNTAASNAFAFMRRLLRITGPSIAWGGGRE